MFSKADYIMVNVSDMSRSVQFYRDALGIPLKFETTGWTEFQTGESTLALHGVGAATSHAGAAGHGGPQAGTCTLGFSVADLDSTVSELKGRGVHFVMEPADQPGEGIRLAVFIDPDGLAITVAQRLTQ